MSITTAQLIFYKSEEVSDAATNGGRLTSGSITDSVSNNIWPNVTEAERTNGVAAQYRKVFCKADSPENLALQNPAVFLERFTAGDDIIYMFPATNEDTQADITGSERLYGCGWLDSQANSGSTSLSVAVENGSDVIFASGDVIRISDKTDPTQAAGNEQILTIVGTPTAAGDVWTITTDVVLSNTYSVGVGSRVAVLHKPSDVQPSFDSVVVVSTSGTLDTGAFPIAMDNRGAVFERWTLTFNSGTTFDVVGDSLGSMGSGSRSSEFALTNADFSTPYFTIPVAAWGGTYVSGDTVDFITYPASTPIWLKRIVPAGSASLSGNTMVIGFTGESA